MGPGYHSVKCIGWGYDVTVSTYGKGSCFYPCRDCHWAGYSYIIVFTENVTALELLLPVLIQFAISSMYDVFYKKLYIPIHQWFIAILKAQPQPYP